MVRQTGYRPPETGVPKQLPCNVDHSRTPWASRCLKPRITSFTKASWGLHGTLPLTPQSIFGQRIFGSKYPLDFASPRTCNQLSFSRGNQLIYPDRSNSTWKRTTGSTCSLPIYCNDANPPHSYDLATIEKSLIAQNVVSDPSDVTYLVIQLRQLPKEARMYIIWALFFDTTLVLVLAIGDSLTPD
jgi:hypothetical protein